MVGSLGIFIAAQTDVLAPVCQGGAVINLTVFAGRGKDSFVMLFTGGGRNVSYIISFSEYSILLQRRFLFLMADSVITQRRLGRFFSLQEIPSQCKVPLGALFTD